MNNTKTVSKIFRYEFQMQYGSIGWSVGATLGYAQAAKHKRIIACIGDGSFQVSISMASMSTFPCSCHHLNACTFKD